jgi:hypothetical protein
MSILKFELKEEHVKLLKNLNWSLNSEMLIVNTTKNEFGEVTPPFGEDNIYCAIDLILNGKPKDFDPLNDDGEITYSNEQMSEWDKLYSELPIALSIILQRQSFEVGFYKAKYHNQVWNKIK